MGFFSRGAAESETWADNRGWLQRGESEVITAKRNGRIPLDLFTSVLLHGADTPATEIYGAGCDSS